MPNIPLYLYLIQDPNVVFPDDGNNREAVRNMIKYYKKSITIKNIYEFICQVRVQVAVQKQLIKKLIIGGHGSGYYSWEMDKGYGHFMIGSTALVEGDKDIDLLKIIAPCFVKEADVYIMACKTGHARILLQQVSAALGGIRVHGYTEYIYTANYGPLGVSLDNGTEDGGQEIVCLPGDCRVK